VEPYLPPLPQKKTFEPAPPAFVTPPPTTNAAPAAPTPAPTAAPATLAAPDGADTAESAAAKVSALIPSSRRGGLVNLDEKHPEQR
jgi:hypothetical protein